jgi:molybdopterin-guanine dinucleotide biosynthesis protein A
VPLPALNDVTLAVLAGGAGSRMGRPKGLLEVGGRPVLTFLLERLAWPGPTLLVTAPGRERPPGWKGFDAEAVDPVADEGPLRGVMTALSHATTGVAVVVAVDMPGATRDDLEWLVGELMERPGSSAVMASRAGKIEPLPCAVRAETKELVAARLATGRRSLHGLAEDARVVVLPADDREDRTWLNANTPGEWELIVRELLASNNPPTARNSQ